jgi:hypothetical protein
MEEAPTELSLADFGDNETYKETHSEYDLECIYGRLLRKPKNAALDAELDTAVLDTVISRLAAADSKNKDTAKEVRTYITSPYYTDLIRRTSRVDHLSHADELLSGIYNIWRDDPIYRGRFATFGGAKYKKRRTIKKRRTFRKRRTIRRHK